MYDIKVIFLLQLLLILLVKKLQKDKAAKKRSYCMKRTEYTELWRLEKEMT